MEILSQIAARVVAGSVDEVAALTQQAVQQGIAIQKIMDEGYLPGLRTVGERYTAGEFFLPEMLVAGMAVSAGMEVVRPLFPQSTLKPKGTIVAGIVKGDMHDIGKNIVCMMSEGSGFKVIDLGVDTPAAKFIRAAKESEADIIAMSALLSTTRQNMKGIIEGIRAAGLSRVKIMVGGAAVTADFAQAIGADGYSPDAGLAIKKAQELLGIK